ncbi:hypothetical protein ACWEO1_36255 [Kitasatospora cineracea]
MDIVYASLHRKDTTPHASAGEADEVLATLWAHARPADAIRHITVRCEADRIDLLIYLAAPDRPRTDPQAVVHQLLIRALHASPLLSQRYLLDTDKHPLSP